MNIIEKKSPIDFKTYLKQYDNTICGNHPISILLNVNFKLINLTINI